MISFVYYRTPRYGFLRAYFHPSVGQRTNTDYITPRYAFVIGRRYKRSDRDEIPRDEFQRAFFPDIVARNVQPSGTWDEFKHFRRTRDVRTADLYIGISSHRRT